jgi:hypothetical protein
MPQRQPYTFAEDVTICLLWQAAGYRSLDEDDPRVVELSGRIPHSAASISRKTSDYSSIDRNELILTRGGTVPQTRAAYAMIRQWQQDGH